MHVSALSRVLATTAIALTLVSQPAFAKPSSVFMLQFGSFESRQEADERLATVKSKQAGAIGSLPTRVVEVSLPDNLTVYRTQAGPVATRGDAQNLCQQMAAGGDECYVVETAMTNDMSAPVSVASSNAASSATTDLSAAPSAIASAAMGAGTAAVTSASDKATTTAQNAVKSVAPADASTPLPSFSAAATPSAKTVSNEIASQAVTPDQTDMPNVRALTSAPPVVTTPSMNPPSASVTAASGTTTLSDQEPKTATFWSHMNPFSKSPEQPKAAPAPVAPMATPAPVEKVVAADTAPAPVALPPKTSMTTDQAMHLPPPPPLNSGAKSVYDQNVKQAAVEPAPLPVASASNMPTPTSAPMPVVAQNNAPFAPASAETMARLGDGSGNVTVGEAQRVPLTNDVNPMFVPSGSRIAPPDATTPVYPPGIRPPAPPFASPEAALPPSQPMGKTLWAEIGNFASSQDALAYWDNFRNANPDFPVVRVRVTQPYISKLKGESDVNLRVGPFAKPESIGYLCNSISHPADEHSNAPAVGCHQMTDLGISSSKPTAGPRSRMLLGQAYAERTMAQSTQIPDNYWIQLGSYPTLSQANERWSELKKKHGRNLPGKEPNITVPAMNSTATPLYRLRSGPFTTKDAALAACNMVKNGGGECIISNN